MMNSRERLRRCYFNEEIDRPAVYSRTGFPVNDPSYDKLKSYIEAHTELKRGWNAESLETPYPTELHRETYSEDFERRVTILHTPSGNLQSSMLVSLKNQPGLTEIYFIKSREDAEKYLSLPLPKLSSDVSSFFAAREEVGERGIVHAGIGLNPGGFVVELFGSETFAIMSMTDRDIIHALCERQMTIIMNRLKVALAQKVGPYFSMLGQEYIVPPIHGPKDFHDFNARYDKPIIDYIHNAGGRIHIHCHGSIKSVLAGFVEMGVDVLHPFEAPPRGDIQPAEAKEIIRGKMCMEGNIQIADMYEQSSEDIKAQVSALIETVFDDHKGLIVCPTASPYVYGKGEECFENYKTLIDTVLKYAV